MSGIVDNIRAKIKRRVSHKDPQHASADEETNAYVNKEVEEAEREGDKYPEGRPNSFLNRMISHGNKKTEDEVARDYADAQAREAARLKTSAISSGQTTGAGQSNVVQ